MFFSAPSNFQNLPSLETYDILQDSKGFLWIMTDAGICRFDGNKLTVFTSKDGIPENVVFKAYEDNKGRIWFSTLSGYFFYYYNQSFHPINANEQLKTIAHSLSFNSFFIGKNDTLCAPLYGEVAGAIKGTMKIPPQNNYSTILIDSNGYKEIDRYVEINPLHPDEFIYGSGKKGMDPSNSSFSILYNKNILQIKYKEADLQGGNMSRGEVDRFGNAYLQTGQQLDVITKNGVHKGSFYFDDRITTCYVDYNNDLWVCTYSGGYLFKNSDLNKVPIRFLKDVSLAKALLDREGTLWVATLEKGVVRSVNAGILYFNEEKDKPIFLQKDSNRLNISYRSTKIISMLRNDSIFIETKLAKKKNTGGRLSVSFIDADFFCVGTGSGVSVYSQKKNNTPSFTYNGIEFKDIVRVGRDSLIFVSPAQLVIFFKGKDTIIRNPFPIRAIAKLNNQKIVVSSRNNSGIYEFSNNKFTPYLANLAPLRTRINSMVEDTKGNLWFATNEHGLYCYDTKKQLHQFTTANGMITDKINALAIDDKGNLWLGSYSGLTKLSYSAGLDYPQITNFNKNHGLPNVQVEKLMAFNGKIICISKDVCFYFQENHLRKNTVPPLNYIESVSINDISFDPKNKPVLTYDQNNLRVKASLISFKDIEQQTFLYKLIGYDNNWHASSTGEIGYTNLPHGNYVLTIYGLNNDNIKSNKPATFAFVISPPFWCTWWFILIESFSFLVVFYFAFRFWKMRIQKRAHDKALINQKIAEFKMTALRSQMNPHFVFNAISSIQHYILKQDTFNSYNYLSKFSLLIRTILDNSKEEYIALSQELNTLKLYIELEQIRFKEPFRFILVLDKELDMDTHIPTMLIQPYIENSIWHGLMPKKTNCILQLTLKKREAHIFVSIKDNGVGRNKTEKRNSLHESKGMSITEQRIKELETTNERKFNVTILDLSDEDGNAAGTEVQIIIPFDL